MLFCINIRSTGTDLKLQELKQKKKKSEDLTQSFTNQLKMFGFTTPILQFCKMVTLNQFLSTTSLRFL